MIWSSRRWICDRVRCAPRRLNASRSWDHGAILGRRDEIPGRIVVELEHPFGSASKALGRSRVEQHGGLDQALRDVDLDRSGALLAPVDDTGQPSVVEQYVARMEVSMDQLGVLRAGCGTAAGEVDGGGPPVGLAGPGGRLVGPWSSSPARHWRNPRRLMGHDRRSARKPATRAHPSADVARAEVGTTAQAGLERGGHFR